MSSRDCEVGFPQILQVQEPVRRTGVDDPAFLHDVSEIRDPKGLIGVLLDEEEREATLPLLADLLEDLRHGLRCEAEDRFVEDQDQRLRHQCAADADHLLLPAAQADRF